MPKKILVVEDERIIANDIKRSLKELGYSVASVAASGEEAIKQAAEKAPDLVLMDIMLKGNVDGIKAAAHIRENFNIPVVYLTSHSDESTLKRAKETGPFGYLLKPYEDRELRTTIEMAIYSHTVERMLKEKERWLSITLRSIADGVIVVDSSWSIEFMNPVAESLTGWEFGDARGRSLREVFRTVFETDELLARVYNEGAMAGAITDTFLIARDGGEVPVSLSAAPISEDTVTGLVLTFHDISERMKAEQERKKLIEELDHLSKTDRLTGLSNRDALIDRLENEIQRALRYKSRLTLIHGDIDHLKDINDTYGHAAGDMALRRVAESINGEARRSDIAGRYGGDEFLIILPESSLKEGKGLAGRIRKAIGAMKFEAVAGERVKMSMSFGVAQFKEGDNSDTLIKRADDALYISKREGRDRVSSLA
jgi:diguanylate cyclase (GGDEF)-like protein/PAS domain S-box-containing protein